MSTAAIAADRLTTAEFERLIAAGHFDPEFRGYLWDGEIIEKMAGNPPHSIAVKSICKLLERRYPEEAWTILQKSALDLRDGYRPEPDVMVLKGPIEAYFRRLPVPADVERLVEVADSTLAMDLGKKLREYAAEGIPAYWVADVEGRSVLAFRDPDPATGTYRVATTHGPGSTIPLAAGPVAVDNVFRHLLA